jgi:glutamate-1-semialdehyde aminotransferase
MQCSTGHLPATISYESWFMSNALSKDDLDKTIEATKEFCHQLNDIGP